jgi:hypothetical protein
VPERNVFFYKKSTQMVMLTAALFGIAQKWKLKFWSYIDKHVHKMQYFFFLVFFFFLAIPGPQFQVSHLLGRSSST